MWHDTLTFNNIVSLYIKNGAPRSWGSTNLNYIKLCCCNILHLKNFKSFQLGISEGSVLSMSFSLLSACKSIAFHLHSTSTDTNLELEVPDNISG